MKSDLKEHTWFQFHHLGWLLIGGLMLTAVTFIGISLTSSQYFFIWHI